VALLQRVADPAVTDGTLAEELARCVQRRKAHGSVKGSPGLLELQVVRALRRHGRRVETRALEAFIERVRRAGAETLESEARSDFLAEPRCWGEAA
jgi:hypothetical protein